MSAIDFVNNSLGDLEFVNDGFGDIDIKDEDKDQSFQTITKLEIPTQSKWRLNRIYKVDNLGSRRIWEIRFDGIDTLITEHGQEDGKHQIVELKIVPKAGRDMQQQALLQARKKYDDKFVQEGYRPGGCDPPSEPKAMLAQHWIPNEKMDLLKSILDGIKKGKSYDDNYLTQVGLTQDKNGKWKKNPQWRVTHGTVTVQAKIDGIRMMSYAGADGLVCTSRGKVVYKHLKHLEEQIMLLLSYLPQGTVIDGELYIANTDYNHIQSIVTTVKHPFHPKLETLEYYIFDIIVHDDEGFNTRYNSLINAYYQFVTNMENSLKIKILEAHFAENDNDVLNFHQRCVDAGMEGVMVRTSHASYQQGKRTADLLKYKVFIDEEVTIIGVEEGQGTHQGAAIFKVRDDRDNEFMVTPSSPIHQRKYWFTHQHEVIGKRYIIKYQELSTYGIPRFPIGKAIRIIN